MIEEISFPSIGNVMSVKGLWWMLLDELARANSNVNPWSDGLLRFGLSQVVTAA